MSIARHTAYNLAGYFAPVAVTLVTVPIYLKLIGLDRYGLLAICWTMVGFLGFLSLGLGPAMARQLGTLRDAPDRERSDLFWSAATLDVFVAAAGAAAIILVAHYYFATVEMSAQLRGEVADAMPWLAATVAVSLAGGMLTGSLQGRQWFGALNAINICSSVGTALLPIAAALYWGPRFEHLVIAMLAVNVVSFSAQLVACSKAVPVLSPTRPSPGHLRQLFSYGGWMSLLSFVAPITMLVDRFAIGSRLGSAAVPIYVIPYSLVSRVIALPASLSSASLPKLAAAKGREEQALLTLGLRLLLACLTPVCVAGNLVMAPFLHLWVGDAIAGQGATVGSILVFGFWMHGVGHIPSTVLLGRGRPDVLAKLYLIYLVPYFALLLGLLHVWGVVGAAVAWAVRASMDFFLFCFARTGRRQAVEIAACTVLVLLSSVAALVLDWRHAAFWAVMAVLLLVSLAAAIVVMPNTMFARLRERLRFWSGPADQEAAPW